MQKIKMKKWVKIIGFVVVPLLFAVIVSEYLYRLGDNYQSYNGYVLGIVYAIVAGILSSLFGGKNEKDEKDEKIRQKLGWSAVIMIGSGVGILFTKIIPVPYRWQNLLVIIQIGIIIVFSCGFVMFINQIIWKIKKKRGRLEG